MEFQWITKYYMLSIVSDKKIAISIFALVQEKLSQVL